ncbi:MAG: SBBP repeat-containing protein, partial [Bryobacteraceae bacterium]
VRMKFDGASRLSLNPEGDLVINGAEGTVIEKRPVIYQQDSAGPARTEVQGGYLLLGRHTVGLRLDRYDPKRALVVDPVLAYSTYMGGSVNDYITAVQTDNQGNLYVAGATGTSDLVASSTAYATANEGDLDIFLAVINNAPGSGYPVTYLTYIGGTNDDIPLAMAVDSSQNMYVAGTTKSTAFPLTENAFDSVGGASYTAAFALVLNPGISGTSGLVFSSYLGGTTGAESANAVAYDSSGNMYVAGTTASTDWPVTSNAYASAINGPEDAYIAQINPTSGILTYGSYMGGELLDDGRGIAVGANGLVYFACSSNSTMFPAAGNQYQPNRAGAFDVVVGVMDLTQVGVDSLLYTTYLGGTQNDMARGLTLDPSGNIVVTGYTLSSDFPVTADAAQPTYAGNGDTFVSVLNYSNSKFVLYSTYLGGSDAEVGYAVTTDAAGYIYVTGYTLSQDFPVTANTVQGAWGGGIDVFVTKIKPHVAGSAGIVWSTFLGGATVNNGYSLVVGSDGRVYVGGSTGGGFPVNSASYQAAYQGGNTDGFLAVISQ